jgi:hypothetical protein
MSKNRLGLRRSGGGGGSSRVGGLAAGKTGGLAPNAHLRRPYLPDTFGVRTCRTPRRKQPRLGQHRPRQRARRQVDARPARRRLAASGRYSESLLRRLQSAQSSCKFSIVVAPPSATGKTWSY